MRKKIFLWTIALVSYHSYAQDTIQNKKLSFKEIVKRGSVYFSWGYNRDIYSASDVHFHDSETLNYDFTWHDALAHDQPDASYLLKTAPTIPQYNLNVGFMLNDKRDLGVEISWDHLKYVIQDPQILRVTGQIQGVPIDQTQIVGMPDYHLEHTNGNNYLMLNLVKRFKLYKTKRENYLVSLLIKPGAGGLIPKTDSHVLGYHNDGPFRLSGWVAGVETGLRQEFFKYFHITASVKQGFVDYTNIKLYATGRATQTFSSTQFIISAGAIIPLHKTKAN